MERKSHVDSVLKSLSHADDAARAYAESFFLRDFDCLDFHVVGVARADVREIPARSLDVVVVARNARFSEPFELLAGDESHRSAKVDAKFFVHALVDMNRLFKIFARKRTTCRNDGESVYALVLVCFCLPDDFFFVKEIVGFARSVVVRALSAEFTVLAASAAPTVDNRA